MNHGEDEHPYSEDISRLASVGEIAAGVAHEIRNPLTSVKGLLQLLRKEHDFQHWDIVFSELDQAINHVQSLLTVSKPTKETEPSSDFSLCVELENILSLFQHDTYRIQFQKEWQDKSVLVRGKRNQIKQALFNLIKNACEAIDDRGSISIEHRRVSDRVQLIITDDGTGMPPDVLERLGTPFFTTKLDGTGIGIAQVYSVMDENDATIDVQSIQGVGTTFTLHFPISPLYAKNSEGGLTMQDIKLSPAQTIQDFFRINRRHFNNLLEHEAQTTFRIVADSQYITREDLLQHAYQIAQLVNDGQIQEIVEFAQQRGKVWAQSDIPIISKMEWFSALRKVIWSFLEQFHNRQNFDTSSVFAVADKVSEALDTFVVHFNVSFTKYREEVLQKQRAMIRELSVPVIPLLDGTAILPIVGTLDNQRFETIESSILEQLEGRGIQTLFIELSTAIITDDIDISILERILIGLELLGCETVLTGISAKLARSLLHSDRGIATQLNVKSTLKQAMEKTFQNRLANETQ